MSTRLAARRSAAQLTLLEPVSEAPTWSLDGAPCASCDDGRLYMVTSSDPCACAEAICICLAEGYAMCDCCGDLRQIWPREMETHWAHRG